MTLTKTTTIDKMEILESGHIQIREATKIIEDGNVISKSFHRRVISPGDDATNENDEIKSIAGIVQTKEKIDKYKAQIEQNKPGG